jgi:endonuclease YncB( thermonuclease family)
MRTTLRTAVICALTLAAACYRPPDLPITPYETPILSSDSTVVDTCAPRREARISAVKDGDTFSITSAAGVEDVRMLGVNAPETSGGTPECLGEYAKAVATAALDNQLVTLTFDQQCQDNDIYRRTLAYAWIDPDNAAQYLDRNVLDEMSADFDTGVTSLGLMFNEYLIRAGLGCWYDQQVQLGLPEPLYEDNRFIIAERIAKSRKLGIWSDQCAGADIEYCDDF